VTVAVEDLVVVVVVELWLRGALLVEVVACLDGEFLAKLSLLGLPGDVLVDDLATAVRGLTVEVVEPVVGRLVTVEVVELVVGRLVVDVVVGGLVSLLVVLVCGLEVVDVVVGGLLVVDVWVDGARVVGNLVDEVDPLCDGGLAEVVANDVGVRDES